MKYKLRFAAFFTAMIVFNLAANFAHPVTPTVIQELQLLNYRRCDRVGKVGCQVKYDHGSEKGSKSQFVLHKRCLPLS